MTSHDFLGTVIFDMNANSLSSVAEKVADELLNRNEIRASDRDGLLRALLMRRRYSNPSFSDDNASNKKLQIAKIFAQCSFYLPFQSGRGTCGYSFRRHSDADIFCYPEGTVLWFSFSLAQLGKSSISYSIDTHWILIFAEGHL